MIAIIDYGMGNLRSVQKAFDRLNIQAVTTSNKNEILNSKKIILPGVGHFKHGMENLKRLDLIGLLNTQVIENKVPILGICLGMQLLTKFSAEGNCAGLGWIDAETKVFKFNSENDQLKIPHMGWNTIHVKFDNNLLRGYKIDYPYYFVHSYYVPYTNDSGMATTQYGISFSSIIFKDNIFGTQFHPEKSHHQGLQILKNFAEYQYV